MKHKLFYTFLACEAIACVILSLAGKFLFQGFSVVMAFPFEQIGSLLRMLSLSGSLGNLVSIVIYSAICLIPLIILFLLRKKRKLYAEDTLLVVLSAVLFIVIYYMVNPGFLSNFLGSSLGYGTGKAFLGVIVYSVLVSYVLIRITRLFFSADAGRLQKYLMILLYSLNIFVVFFVFGARFSELLDSFARLRQSNTGNEDGLGISYVFLVLGYIADAISTAMIIPVVIRGQNLLSELSSDRYSEMSVICAERLSRTCRLAVVLSILSNLGYNLLQLVFIRKLFVTDSTILMPVFSIAFLLAALLFAQYIRETRQLKEDHDMII